MVKKRTTIYYFFFIKYYDELFKKDALIVQKTDNDDLFSYSLETLKDYGYFPIVFTMSS